jgi:RNA polymerase sigma-70 factor (ECF subfamily)
MAIGLSPVSKASTRLSSSQLLPSTAPAWSGTDSELVALVRQGHVHASKWLHDRFSREITRVVFRILGGDADDEDLVHEIFMRIWALIADGKVHEPESLRPWVISVATHMLYKELRRRYVRRRFLLQRESAPAAVANIQDEEARDLLLAVYQILAEMPPIERLIFGLRYIDQRSLVDLAPMCSVSLATAKRKLAKAEETFRRLAERFGDYPALLDLIPEKTTQKNKKETLR